MWVYKELKIKTIKELKKMTKKDLIEELKTTRKKMFLYEMRIQIDKETKVHLVRYYRRYIARLKTFLYSVILSENKQNGFKNFNKTLLNNI